MFQKPRRKVPCPRKYVFSRWLSSNCWGSHKSRRWGVFFSAFRPFRLRPPKKMKQGLPGECIQGAFGIPGCHLKNSFVSLFYLQFEGNTGWITRALSTFAQAFDGYNSTIFAYGLLPSFC